MLFILALLACKPTRRAPEVPCEGDCLAPSFALGVSTLGELPEPRDLAFTPQGELLVGGFGSMLHQVDMEGVVEEQPPGEAPIRSVGGVVVDDEGVVYATDPDEHHVLRIEQGEAQVYAGSPGLPGFEDGEAALFARPRGLARNAEGELLVADTGNDLVRVVDEEGQVHTLSDQISAPVDLVELEGVVYVLSADSCLLRLTEEGAELVAGVCGSPGFADGAGAQALFDTPMNLVADLDGQLLVADTLNDRVRSVDPETGEVGSVTGSDMGFEDGQLEEALFNAPRGLAVDEWGNLFVADSLNEAVRVVVR